MAILDSGKRVEYLEQVSEGCTFVVSRQENTESAAYADGKRKTSTTFKPYANYGRHLSDSRGQ